MAMADSVTRKFAIEVEGATATFELLPDYCPRSTEAFWEALPISTQLRHGKLSGEACFFDVTSPSLLALPDEPELPVTSMYRGYLSLVVFRELEHAELLISYGTAEYRWPTGRRYVSPIARTADGDALFDVLRRMFSEGAKVINVSRMEA
jgi:hypothetical protein